MQRQTHRLSRFNTQAAALVTALSLGVAAQAQTINTSAASSSAQGPMARVLSVQPNLEQIIETRQQCTQEVQTVTHATPSSSGGAVLGAIAGGLLASNVGKGNGNKVAIAAGSATGALVGKNLAEQNTAATTSTRTVDVCKPVNTVREQVRDYAVRYEFDGREYQVNLPRHPGQWLKVNVSHSVSTI